MVSKSMVIIMYREKRLSNVTENYLSEFYCILDRMIESITEAELTDSISHNFIVQMIPHHRAAIGMSITHCNTIYAPN